MKTTAAVVFALLAAAAPARAQQQSPSEQAIAQKLMVEIRDGISCSTLVITLQQQLLAAQTELRGLRAPGPKDETSPK